MLCAVRQWSLVSVVCCQAVVSGECCVLSGSGLCDWPTIRPAGQISNCEALNHSHGEYKLVLQLAPKFLIFHGRQTPLLYCEVLTLTAVLSLISAATPSHPVFRKSVLILSSCLLLGFHSGLFSFIMSFSMKMLLQYFP